ARRRRQGLRHRSHHVPPRLPDAAPAGHDRRRARKGLLPVEPDGQLRVARRVRRPVRASARGLQDAEADAQAQRRVVPRSGWAQRGCVVRDPIKSRGDDRMRTRATTTAAALLALLGSLTPSSRAQQTSPRSVVLITNAKVFDGKSDKLSAKTSVLVVGNKI